MLDNYHTHNTIGFYQYTGNEKRSRHVYFNGSQWKLSNKHQPHGMSAVSSHNIDLRSKGYTNSRIKPRWTHLSVYHPLPHALIGIPSPTPYDRSTEIVTIFLVKNISKIQFDLKSIAKIIISEENLNSSLLYCQKMLTHVIYNNLTNNSWFTAHALYTVFVIYKAQKQIRLNIAITKILPLTRVTKF